MSFMEEPYFTAEDRGSYRHPEYVGGILYTELEDRVFKAIDAGFRTLPRLKEHAGLDRSFDLSWVIEGMEMDEKIRRCDSGTFTAFFRFEQMPERFWNNGDGTIKATFVEGFVPDYRNKRAAETREAKEADKGKGREAMPITGQQMEDAAADHNDANAIARALGYGGSAGLYARLKAEPKLRLAFDRGRRRFAIRNFPDQFDADGKPKSSPVAKAPSGKRNPGTTNEHIFPQRHDGNPIIDIAPAALEKAMAKHGTHKLAAQSLDIGHSTLRKKLSESPALRSAEERGRATFHKNQEENMGIEITADEFRDYGRQGVSVKDIAGTYGLSQQSIYNRLKDPAMNVAYEDGKRMRRLEQNGHEPDLVEGVTGRKPPKPRAVEKHSRTPITLPDPADVEELAYQGKSYNAAARELGIAISTFTKYAAGEKNDKSVQDAWQRGLARRNGGHVAAPAIESEGKIERFKPEPKSRIGMEVESEWAEYSVEREAAIVVAPVNGNPTMITLSNGSRIALGFDGNFFGLTKQERDLMNGIADLIEEGVNA